MKSLLKTPERVENGLFRLRIGNAQHRAIYDAIKSGDAVRAEAMMCEYANIMIEYTLTYEKRDANLTAQDLVAYLATDFDSSA